MAAPTSSEAQGERALTTLLTTLSPRLDPTPYIYMHLPPHTPLPASITALLASPPAPESPAQTAFYEPHRAAWTLILPAQAAESSFPPDAGVNAEVRATFWPCALITLDVHSSLAGVGFMAAVSAALAGAGIGCNPVAGWFSDHLFVAPDDAERAVGVLSAVRERAVREASGAGA